MELAGDGEPGRSETHNHLSEAAGDAELFLLSSCTHRLTLQEAEQTRFTPSAVADRNTYQSYNRTIARAIV